MSEYEPVGAEFVVNSIINANQIRPTVTRLANGGFVVIWQTNDTTQDGSSGALKGQIFDASGTKVGTEFLVNTATIGGQQNADVTVLANGNFVVTWDSSDPLQDGSGFSVKAQIFSSTGVKIGSELLVNTTAAGDQSVAEVAALANGGFVITWSEFGGNFDQFGQVFDALGTKVGSEFAVNAASGGLEDSGEVVGLANGTFLVTWRTSLSLDGNLNSIMGRIFNANGTPAGTQFVVNTQATGNQTNPTATALDNGNFVVAWRTDDSVQDGSSWAIKAQIFSSNGTKIGGEFLVNTQTIGTQSEPKVSELPGGGFIITWRTGDILQDGSGAAIKAQVFDANGAKVGAEFLVNQWGSGDQTLADISTLSNGDVVITWTSVGADGSGSAVSARMFAAVSPATIISNGGGDTAAVFVDENTVGVTTVVATGGSGVLYSITGGADAALFAIDAATGTLTFVAAPDFEAPGDTGGDNIYNVTVTASDGAQSDSQAIAVTVTSGNDAPVILGSPDYVVGENSLIVGGVSAIDPDGDTLIYTIVGGADAARFAINAQTGVLSFVQAPNYEQPVDADANNIYNIQVAVSDGTFSTSQTLNITVTNVNEAAVFVSSNNVILPENFAISHQVQAVDPDSPAAALTYSITGGADAALFAINANTGHISFLATPDYESPEDAGENNIYNVTVSVSDGVNTTAMAMMFQVYDTNEAPIISSLGGGTTATVSIAENNSTVTTVTASDPELNAITYSISGGTDAGLFAIDPLTGALSFVNAPNFEAPTDSNGDNLYQVIVRASDGSLSDTQTITVTVTNTNEAPVLTSPNQFAGAESGTAVGNIVASDPDGTSPSYAITGGADAALFAIDASTGALSFVGAPDFEAPGDAGGDNVYDIVVTASDGSLSNAQAVTVTVSNANEAPAITSPSSVSVSENGTAAATITSSDPEGTARTYAITGGADAALFTIDAVTGALSFVAAPDYEAPADAGGDNVYDVVVSANDGSLSASQALAVLVTNTNEAPSITSPSTVSVSENGTVVTTVTSSDPEGTARTYAITGGLDAARFAIDAVTGALSFVSAPDYEAPSDSDGNNVYDVVVSVSDGALSSSQALAVTVTNANEAPVITSNGGGTSASIARLEGASTAVTTVTSTDPDGNPRTYSISGGSDAVRFTINSVTGLLSFVASANFEAPTDSNGDNVYEVVVTASDGSLSDSQTIAVTIGNLNESPAITSNGGGDTASITVNENSTAVTVVSAPDPDGTAPSYAITGGTDAARFTINAVTGVLSFIAAPNYEAPTDSNGDNVYQVEVRASDGTYGDYQMITITVANLVDGLTLTGTSKANTLTGGSAEDTISGLGGNDTLNGLGGNDTLNGGDGNDTLVGGAGADVLTGGLGADTFVFQSLTDSGLGSPDLLTDFSTAQSDKISLSAIDANTSLAGDQAFTWIGTGAFTNVAGQLRYYQQNGDTFVTGDVNGDGVGDFLIRIDPLVALGATNFLL